MNMNPKVSIVIPVYNGSNYMREAIDSALNQIYPNCEVIVVNDGSKDNSEEVALSYGNKIRYFSKENGGVSTALNLGIEKMTGEYFCYLPHDDIFLPEKTEKQIRAIQQSGDETTIVWSKMNVLLMNKNQCIEEVSSYFYYDFKQLTNGNFPVYLGLVRTIGVMIHKSHFEKKGVFDKQLITSQDYDMWYRIFQNKRTIYIDEPLVCYRLHAEQGTNTDVEYYNNCVELAMKKFKEISREEIETLFGNRYRFLYYMMVYYKEEAQWKECWELARDEFLDEKEPEEVSSECEELKEMLIGKDNNTQLILWCAGNNAKRLIADLEERRIPIFGLCDGDKTKQGKILNGYKCFAPKEVPLDAKVIVTKDNPEELVTELRKAGFHKAISFKEIGSKVHYIMPFKDEVIKRRINSSL